MAKAKKSAPGRVIADPAKPRTEIYGWRFDPVDNDWKVELNFHAGQWQVWRSPARFVLMLSGTQGGKTSFGPWWLRREIYGEGEDKVTGKWLHPPRGRGDYLAATTSYDLFKLKMLPEMRNVFEKINHEGRYWPGDKVIELKDPETHEFWAKQASDPMWGRIILRSAEAPAGMESATINAAWLDEVGMDTWDVTTFEAVLRRLSLAQGRLLGTTTVYNSGWIKTEWYDRWAGGDKNYDIIQFSSVENPAFPKEEFERAEATMPEWRFGMFYEGIFTQPAGLIYGAFKDRTMWIPFDESQYALHIPRIVGVDPGGANNASIYVLHDTSVSPSVFYVYDEYLEGGMSTKELTRLAKERTMGLRDIKWIGGAHSEIQFRADWQAGGIPIYEPSVADVESGIANIIELFKTNRLKISNKCKGLRHELMTYRRRILPDGTVTEVIENKANFHRLDALRYALGSPQDAGWESLRGLSHIDDFVSKWGEPTGTVSRYGID